MGIKTILIVFFETIKHLKRNAMTGTHGALQVVAIGLKCPLQLLEEYHSRITRDINANTPLKTSIIFALNKLEDYLEKTN